MRSCNNSCPRIDPSEREHHYWRNREPHHCLQAAVAKLLFQAAMLHQLIHRLVSGLMHLHLHSRRSISAVATELGAAADADRVAGPDFAVRAVIVLLALFKTTLLHRRQGRQHGQLVVTEAMHLQALHPEGRRQPVAIGRRRLEPNFRPSQPAPAHARKLQGQRPWEELRSGRLVPWGILHNLHNPLLKVHRLVGAHSTQQSLRPHCMFF
mmetsp:Transcript_179323/g.568992  ORF Transcript_179323/g.568992 Transcript_179323/m.568992 type:complete len:210 (-) Transcript_179323:1287-1916(-)